VPTDVALRDQRPVARSEIVRGLRELEIPAGVVMVHTRMSALGWVVGGAESIVRALLDAVGTEGTVMALAGWADDLYHVDEWPPEWQRAYREEFPAFDAMLSEAAQEMVGRVPERIRTWPGARRSDHPEASVVALGAKAEAIVTPHPADEPYGRGTPLARLVEAGGSVLSLGAPLDTITLLHHAEALAEVEGKRRVTCRMPVLVDGERAWREFHDIDTSNDVLPYRNAVPPGIEPFEFIAREALAAGCGRAGMVAGAQSYVFDAARLTSFAIAWMESTFGATRSDTP
jgi:aminoglycoside 3-N-acetyltransferase